MSNGIIFYFSLFLNGCFAAYNGILNDATIKKYWNQNLFRYDYLILIFYHNVVHNDRLRYFDIWTNHTIFSDDWSWNQALISDFCSFSNQSISRPKLKSIGWIMNFFIFYFFSVDSFSLLFVEKRQLGKAGAFKNESRFPWMYSLITLILLQ